MENLLEVRDLKTYFYTDNGIVKAVDGVSFDVEPGKTLGIVGESGCGKSITSMSILKLIDKPGKIVDGTIKFDSKDIVPMEDKDIRKVRGNDISMIFQEPMTSLNPVFRIEDQIMEAVMLHQGLDKKEARKIAIDMLAFVGIPRPEQVARDYPHQLSGGMRQRVMIAMALACRPKLLIADEPTTALTHDLGVIAQMADHVIVMYSGKVVESAPIKELFDNPKHPYTKGLLASIPSLDQDKERLYSIDGVVPNPFHLPEGCYFEPRCEFAKAECKCKMPAITNISDEHQVRCFLYNEAIDEKHHKEEGIHDGKGKK